MSLDGNPYGSDLKFCPVTMARTQSMKKRDTSEGRTPQTNLPPATRIFSSLILLPPSPRGPSWAVCLGGASFVKGNSKSVVQMSPGAWHPAVVLAETEAGI